MQWKLLFGLFLCLLVSVRPDEDVESHHRHTEGGRHRNSRCRHHHRLSEHSSEDRRHHFGRNKHPSVAELSHGGGSVRTTDEENNSSEETEPKFINIELCSNSQPQPQKLLVFNTERYGNWSDWSKCLVKDCIEVRYRMCEDDSWEHPSPNPVQTTKCLSKYYVEKRTCSNKTLCSAPVVFENCGVRPGDKNTEPKILGGSAAEPHSWPWAVRLSIKLPRRQPITFCGGTLISPQWILTAAHCLLVENRRMPVGKLITLADHMRSTIYAHLGDHHKEEKEKLQQDFRVNKAILHPRYHRKLMTDGDDIALLYLAEPVKIMPEVNYACLPSKTDILEPGTKCYAVGWGNSRPGRSPTFDDIQSILDSLMQPFPDIFSSPFPFSRPMFPFKRSRRRKEEPDLTTAELHEVQLPIIGHDECRKHYTDLNDELHVCAGEKGKDTCSGDSGGGLYCQLPKSDKWFVTGVTSFGLARGCGLNPGVYTSVAAHMDWVSQTIAKPVF